MVLLINKTKSVMIEFFLQDYILYCIL